MKKQNIIIVLMIGVLEICSSCADYLKEDVISDVGYSYLNTSKGIEAGIGAAYSTLRWAYSGENLHAIQQLGTDTYQEGQDGSWKPALNRYEASLNPQLDLLYQFWENYYKGINRTNTILQNIPNVTDMSEDLKKVRTGEVRFLRGLYYFYLVQTFGKVPLVEEALAEVKTDFKRASVADIYKFILADLDYAVKNLPEQQNDYGRATKYAAEHLISLVYLTRASAVTEDRGTESTDLENAAKYAEDVINSKKYELEKDFKKLWDIDNQRNKEVIFAVQFSKLLLNNNNSGNKIHLYYTMVYDESPGMKRDIENGRPWRRVRPTDFTLYELYDRKNDSRFYKTFKTVWFWNKESNIKKWEVVKDKNGNVIFTPDPSLLGKPKMALGDTAIWVTVERYPEDTNMEAVYASRSYDYYPRNRQTNAKFPQNYKFYDNQRASVAEENGSRDWYLFRLGETYLLAAEAYGRMGKYDKAVEFLNVIRKRAAYKEGEKKPSEFLLVEGGTAEEALKSTEPELLLTENDIKDNFVDFMLDERARELNGECVRKWDLMRAEKLVERVKKYNPEAVNIRDFHKLMPIPQKHIDRLDPKGSIEEEQNEGYY